jgi:hypothetical protein
MLTFDVPTTFQLEQIAFSAEDDAFLEALEKRAWNKRVGINRR